MKNRYDFIDAVRGIAALCVAIDHGMWITDKTDFAGNALIHITRILVSAPAAVIVFFVISGFCIHLPTLTNTFDRKSFVTRRFIRLLVPLLGASVISYAAGFHWFNQPFGVAVVWSLACEMIYYGAYALLRPILNRTLWLYLFALTLLFAVATAFMGADILEYPRRGLLATTLLGAPIWIGGVLAAEFLRPVVMRKALAINIFLWIVVILGGAISAVLRYRFGISYAMSLPVYGLFLPLWLIMNMSLRTPRISQALGAISYSLYLLHQPVLRLLRENTAQILGQDTWTQDAFVFCGVLATTIVFYYVVEQPSHRLARRMTSRTC